MKDFEITLYDIFGYFIPGCVGLIAVYLIAWRIVLPANQDWSTLSTLGWAIVAGVAYVMGHALQALSDVLYGVRWSKPEKRILEKKCIDPLKDKMKSALHKAEWANNLSIKEDNSQNILLYEIVDQYIRQHGKTKSRDMYRYREGFYKGLSVGFILLAVGAVVHMTGGQTTINALGISMTLTTQRMAFISALSVIIAILTWCRYRKFVEYRVKNCLYSFLTIAKLPKDGCSQ